VRKPVYANRLFHAQTDGILDADVVLHAQHLEISLQVFIHSDSYRCHPYIMTDSYLAVNNSYYFTAECISRPASVAAAGRGGSLSS
jgi:hypothetical protein